MTFPPLIIWVKALFFFEQPFPVVARTWLEKEVYVFFWPEISVFGQEIHTTQILVNGPFVALGETVHFPPWDRFFDFLESQIPFPRYSSFCKKKPG